VTIFLIVEIPMAIYLIVSAILRLFKSSFLAVFLHFAVQLLNFAVLLSYPINFFIYCRMSRAFRDAFTKLLCPSYIEVRQQRQHSIGTPLLGKLPGPTHAPVEHNHVNLEMKSPLLDVQGSTTVISDSSTKDKHVPSVSFMELPDDGTGTAGKARVSFSDDVDTSNGSPHVQLTHL
jgi:hypothetical protein